VEPAVAAVGLAAAAAARALPLLWGWCRGLKARQQWQGQLSRWQWLRSWLQGRLQLLLLQVSIQLRALVLELLLLLLLLRVLKAHRLAGEAALQVCKCVACHLVGSSQCGVLLQHRVIVHLQLKQPCRKLSALLLQRLYLLLQHAAHGLLVGHLHMHRGTQFKLTQVGWCTCQTVFQVSLKGALIVRMPAHELVGLGQHMVMMICVVRCMQVGALPQVTRQQYFWPPRQHSAYAAVLQIKLLTRPRTSYCSSRIFLRPLSVGRSCSLESHTILLLLKRLRSTRGWNGSCRLGAEAPRAGHSIRLA
jgi:hypothetical protein